MFSIILSTFRGFYRNKINLFFCILFPSILTYLLGSMLDGFYNGDDTIETIHIAYVSETDGKEPVERFLDSLQEEGMLTYEKESGLAEAQERLEAEEIDGICVLESGEPVLYEGADGVKNRTLRTLFQCYLRMETAYVTAFKNTQDPSILQNISYEENEGVENGHIAVKGLGTGQSMMDYYAVAMLVMIIFFACLISGGENVIEDRKLYTQDRIALSPLSPMKVYLGRIIGDIPMCTMQIAAMMLASTLLFHARYCGTWQDNLLLILMFFSVSFAILTFAILLAHLMPISPVLILLPISWVMLALSGSFAKDIHIKGVSEYMPPYIIQQAAFDLTVFGRREGTIQVIAVSGLIFLICFAAGLILTGRRKGR